MVDAPVYKSKTCRGFVGYNCANTNSPESRKVISPRPYVTWLLGVGSCSPWSVTRKAKPLSVEPLSWREFGSAR
jgi:hypothetical protein